MSVGNYPGIAGGNHRDRSLEGIGIEPDIEVDFDQKAYSATGRDSQLDRALEYIRTGK
ncbi:MAG: hypothetical protein IJ069_01650 [Prevotella sp.]|nr:hypothetical protein [Prevotella sp.]MBQ8714138.1 hypothetical protein [Prevotella sp.]